MDCGPTCVRILMKAVTGTDVGKALCDEACECLPGRCVETRQLALALGRLLCPEHVRISFCFLFTEPWGFDFYQKFKSELEEDRSESILRFYREASDLDLAAESRSVPLEELRSFFVDSVTDVFGDFSCRAAIVLLDWSLVATFLKFGRVSEPPTGSYFGHFCILIDIKGEEAVLIDPSSEDWKTRGGRGPVFQGGSLRKLPLNVFEAARRSPGTDEDIVFVSWQPDASLMRTSQGWHLPDPFLSACYQGKSQVVSALLKKRASVEPASGQRLRTTPLALAAWRGHAPLVRLLLEAAAAPDGPDGPPHGGPPRSTGAAVWFAAEAGHAEVLRELLQHRASANLCDADGRSALWAAAKYGHATAVEKALHRNSRDFHALSHLSRGTALPAGARVDEPSSEGTPLAVSAERGHVEVARLLLKSRAAPDAAAGSTGATPVLVAAEAGHVDVLKALLQGGITESLLATRNMKHATALHLAADGGHLAAAKLLLEFAAEVDAGNLNHATPLMLAAAAGFQDVVALLLRDL
eukprot:g7207.t1